MADILLGGSRTTGPDTSAASPATLETVNYLDAEVNWADFNEDVVATLVVWAAVSAGSLVLSLYEVNEDLSLGDLVVSDPDPIVSASQVKHEITIPDGAGTKTYRLVGELTGGVDAQVWWLGVIRGLTTVDETFPVDCTALETAVCNQALGMIGITKPLADVNTDTTVEATMCRLYLTPAQKQVLRAFPWAFATKYADCEVVGGTDSEAVNLDWQYSFRLPLDCIFLRRVIRRGAKRQFDAVPPAFRQAEADGSGRLGFTDYVDENSDVEARTVPIEYTRLQDCPLGDADDAFTEALATLLAHKLAPSLAKNKITAEQWWAKFVGLINSAKVMAANEQQRQRPDDASGDAEWIRARE